MSSSCASLRKLLIILVVILVLILYNTDAQQQCSSLCGVHNISQPFRLIVGPDTCGDRRYNLSCVEEDKHRILVLELRFPFGRYFVQSINYNNFTIRVVDANLLPNSNSFPQYSVGAYDFNSVLWNKEDSYQVYQDSTSNVLAKSLLYARCPKGVDSSGMYVHDGATCMNAHRRRNNNNNNYYSFYVIDGGHGKTLSELGLGDGCRVEFMYLTSWPLEIGRGNISCTDVRRMLFYGFELSWLNSLCKDGSYVTHNGNNHRRCKSSVTSLPTFIASSIFTVIVVLVDFLFVVKFVLGAPCITVLLIYKWRRRHLSLYNGIEDFLTSDNSIMPIRYSYKDIKNITKQFKTKLGNGGFGSVFKGQLRSGRLVAVKLLDKGKSNGQDFINEVATIGRIHHVNVVQLLGFCVEGSKHALIYEFMPNGSLEKYIFSQEEDSSLSCEKLYAISLGVAQGMEYLHNGCNMKILHFDIKPHNILLDENFNPKVSDFGLARLCPTDKSIISMTAARGTIGYMAPELFYRNVGTISYKADVYSFGMLLMEMACRRKNLNALAEQSSQLYFPFWVYDQLHDGKEITIENDSDGEMKLAKKMMIVALWCIQTRPGDRPQMDKVLEMLEGDEELQIPNKPYLYPQDIPAEDVRDDSISSSYPSSSGSISDSKEPT